MPWCEPVDPGARRSGERAVGYVVKCFPRLSETFILNEIRAREDAGERVEIASLRAPTDGRFHPGLAELRAPVTWITDRVRSAERAWEALRDARRELPRLDAAWPELLASPVDDAVQAVDVARWAQAHGVDHLHAHFATTATTVARLAARLTGLPYSFTAHAKDIFHESVDDAALHRAIRDAHHVVTVSDYNVAHLRRRFPDVAGRVRRVYNGVDPEPAGRGGADPAAPRPVGAGPAVVAVGRLVEKKGFPHLVEAAARLARDGTRVPFLIGGSGPDDAALRRQVADAGLTDRVRFLGPLNQAETHDLIRRATVFAAPFVVASDGDREGLPTVVLEAMALGTPVVSTPVTGVPEAVTHGETGLVVGEGDAAALAGAIAALLGDAPLRARLAAAARARVAERFTPGAQAAALARLRRDGVADRAPVARERAAVPA